MNFKLNESIIFETKNLNVLISYDHILSGIHFVNNYEVQVILVGQLIIRKLTVMGLIIE